MINKRNKVGVTPIIFTIIILIIISVGIWWGITNKNLFKSATEKVIELIDMNRAINLSDEDIDKYEKKIREEIQGVKAGGNGQIVLKSGYYALSGIKQIKGENDGAIAYLMKALNHEVEGQKGIILNTKIYSALSFNYIVLGDLDKGNNYFETAKELAIKSKKRYLLCDIYYSKGKALANSNSNVNEAIEILKMAVEYSASDTHKIRNYLFLSTLYKLEEKFDDALMTTSLALEIAIRIDDASLINSCIINIGENYYIQKNFPKAINMFEKLLNMGKMKSEKNIIRVYGYLAECYGREGLYNEYKDFKDKYITLATKMNSKKDLIWMYTIAGEIELNYNNINIAEEYIKLSKDLYKENEAYAYMNTKEVIIFNEIKLNYIKNMDYKDTISSYEALLETLYKRGVRADLSTSIINEILVLAYEKKDNEVFLKYINYFREFENLGKSEAKTDSLFLELNSKVNNAKLNKLRIWGILLLLIVCVNIHLLINSNRKNKRINELNDRLKELNNLDPLTKLYNRTFLNRTLKECYVKGREISYVMMDIDYFKKYNDNYGHVMGDTVLKEVANVIKTVFKEDLAFRYGGEEFSIVSTSSESEVKLRVLELQKELKNLNIIHEFSDVSDRVTLSIGIAEGVVETQEELESLCIEADRNLYISKENGRNRCT